MFGSSRHFQKNFHQSKKFTKGQVVITLVVVLNNFSSLTGTVNFVNIMNKCAKLRILVILVNLEVSKCSEKDTEKIP
jgi:hypothetical protein